MIAIISALSLLGAVLSDDLHDSHIVWIHPLLFLKLTSTPVSKLDSSRLEWQRSTPSLRLPLELEVTMAFDGALVVEAHDGRHRAAILAERGATAVPVRIIDFEEEDAEGAARKLVEHLRAHGEVAVWSQYYDDEEVEEGHTPQREILLR
jgi:hypothetical protein